MDCVGKDDVDTHSKISQSYAVHSLEHSLLTLYLALREEMIKNPDSFKVHIFIEESKLFRSLSSSVSHIQKEM